MAEVHGKESSQVGIKSRREGLNWEHLISASCIRDDIYCFPIGLTCKRVGLKKLIQTKSPFDFMLVYDKKCVFIDAKSINQKSFSYSNLVDHQVRKLWELESRGLKAGYLIYFRPTNQIEFVSAKQLMLLRPGESINSGINLGQFNNFSLKILFMSEQHGC